MISFIVIGYNEGWKLSRCFKGVTELIHCNPDYKYEILYIDSDSTDESVEIALKRNVTRIYKIQGNVNSAVARNKGAERASGEILVFLDGDTEMKPFDLNTIIEPPQRLKYPYVVGFLDDVNYTSDWQYINTTPRSYKKSIVDTAVTAVGGAVFIIGKDTWKRFSGMDERLKRTQDRDLSLRMAFKGLTGIRKAEIFASHHTIPYKNTDRMKKMLIDGSLAYKGVFIRKHLLNPAFYKILIREEWTLICLILSLAMTWFSPMFVFFYLASVLLRNFKFHKSGMVLKVFHRMAQDIVVLFSIFFFYPVIRPYEVMQIK